jgi:hypothetical protein
MSFESYQSFFVVFRKPAEGAATSVKDEGVEANFGPPVEFGTLGGPWEVSFDPKRGGPERAVFEKLDDWRLRPEEGIRYYSGAATYGKVFNLPGEKGSRLPSRFWLDLGTVENIARVRLNGRDLGVVWCAPWRVDISKAAKHGGNHLEIIVANLWPNRLIGDEGLPADCEYGRRGNLLRWPEWLLKGEPRPSSGRHTFSTWKHFDKDSPLLPSGLLGPVTIMREQAGPTMDARHEF